MAARRVRVLRVGLSYGDGQVLHTATSGAVPGLRELRLVIESGGALAAVGASRTNIRYLSGLVPEAIEAEAVCVAGALEWDAPWDGLVAQMDAAFPALSAPARMLFEMAAVDGAARAAGQPVWRWLGGTGAETDSTATNQTLFWQDEAALMRRAASYVERGFMELKLRVGVGPFDEDLRRLTLLRARYPEVRLSIDANGTWPEADAPGRLHALAGLRLDYVEQPLPAAAWTAQAALSAASDIPIMLDEGLDGPAAVARLAAGRAAPLAHLKLAKLGGLDRMVAAARLLSGAGVGVMVGQMNEGVVATLAAAHAAVAVAAPYRELYGADGLLSDPAGPMPRYEAGRLHLPPGPGLGLVRHDTPADAALLWQRP